MIKGCQRCGTIQGEIYKLMSKTKIYYLCTKCKNGESKVASVGNGWDS
jgi:hypothetical protein